MDKPNHENASSSKAEQLILDSIMNIFEDDDELLKKKNIFDAFPIFCSTFR